MTILFITSDAYDLGSHSSPSTDAGSFDSDFTSESAVVYMAPAVTYDMPILLGSAANDLWFHFCVKTAVGYGNRNGIWLAFTNEDGVIIAELKQTSGKFGAKVFGDSTVSGSTVSVAEATLQYVDVNVNVGASITMSFYVDGILQSTATAANTGAKKAADKINIRNSALVQGTASAHYYSQVIATDAENTIDWRLEPLKPNSAGTYSDWVGGYAELGDDSVTTRAESDTAAERVSWVASALGSGGLFTGIRGVVSVGYGSVGASGPQNLKHSVRIGGTNYDGATLAPDGSSPLLEDWAVNPATGVAWIAGDLAALEAGFISVV